jgi:hypothetical protein
VQRGGRPAVVVLSDVRALPNPRLDEVHGAHAEMFGRVRALFRTGETTRLVVRHAQRAHAHAAVAGALVAYFETDSENPVEQQQLFGRVVATDERKGIRLSLEGRRTGEEFDLPPDTRSFQRAGSGEYRLRSTGETVVNPDFTVTLSIRRQGQARGSD